MLIIANRHQADLDGISGGSFVAIVGGIGAILVGTAFLVAACLYCRFCARHSAAFSASRQTCAANSLPVQSDSPRSRTLRLSWLRSEEHTSELQSRRDLVCRLLLEKKNKRFVRESVLGNKDITDV